MTTSKNILSVPTNMLKPDVEQYRTSSKTQAAIDKKRKQLEDHGQLEPLRVSPLVARDGQEFYLIIDGELRWRAATESEVITTLDVVIDDSIKDENIVPSKDGFTFAEAVKLKTTIKQLLCNEDGAEQLHMLEKARAYNKIKYLLSKDSDGAPVTNAMIAKKLGQDESEISRHLRLLDMPEKTAEFAMHSKIGDPKVYDGLSMIERKAPDKAEAALEKMASFESAEQQTGTARELVEELKNEYLPKNKGKKPKLSRPVEIKGISLQHSGDKKVLQIDRARESLRFILTDELESSLKSLLSNSDRTPE